MAIYIYTQSPQKLLNAIRKNIENQTIQTWISDEEGDFTHISQWENKAWMKPYIQDDVIKFGIIGRRDERMKKSVYGVYHGRFAEMLLTHFDSMIDSIKITSKGVIEIDSFK